MVNGLVYHFDRLSDINGNLSRGIVHRLDADTSGIILAAKTNEAHLWLSKQFKDRTVNKTYVSITWGKWEEKSGVIEGTDIPNLHLFVDMANALVEGGMVQLPNGSNGRNNKAKL